MSAIAYITDSKMLDLHRLNAHRTMNFWRLSNNNNFSDFKVGDIVFFLSKDREQMNNKEKGIVGYGRLASINLNSIKYMWDKYGILNGYNTYEEFKDAIRKVSKNRKLPNRISSFYLQNVTFFQNPIYLSECGMKISNNIESYIYLKDESVVLRLFALAKGNMDLWSNDDDYEGRIEREEIAYCLGVVRDLIGDMPISEDKKKKARKSLAKYADYINIRGSETEAYHIRENNLDIIFFHDKDIETRLIIGQKCLYESYIYDIYPYDLNVTYHTSDNDEIINKLLSR